MTSVSSSVKHKRVSNIMHDLSKRKQTSQCASSEGKDLPQREAPCSALDLHDHFPHHLHPVEAELGVKA